MTTFKPKTHHIHHYPEYVENAGPMSRFKCFRFERTHQIHKRCDQASNNFKNKAFSIATTYSLSFSPKYQEIKYETGRILNRNSFRRNKQHLEPFFDLTKMCTEIKELNIKGMDLRKKFFFRFKYLIDDLPVFCEIEYTGKVEENIIIVGCKLKTLEFDEYTQCYKVEFTEEFEIIEYDQLIYHQCTFIENDDLILKDFMIFDDN